MNKIALIIIISTSILITGCGTNQTTHQNTPTKITDSVVVTPDPVITTAPNLNMETKNQPYSITTETFSQGNIEIQYPQIKWLGDVSKEKAINDLIENDILYSKIEEPTKSSDATYTIDELTLDLKYQVTMSTSELLSVVYTGYSNIEGSAHPNNDIYAITIDLKDTTKLKISDFTNMDANLAKKIKQSTAVTNDAVKDGMDKSTLINAIQDMDDQTLIQGLEEQWAYNTFYVTPNSLVVSVDVAHAIGDYALVELSGQYTRK